MESLCVVCGNRNNRFLGNWATVVCQKEELSTHWISLHLSYSQRSDRAQKGGFLSMEEEKIFVGLITSDRKLEVSRKGSKRICESVERLNEGLWVQGSGCRV